jgi:predicted acetyltransferase
MASTTPILRNRIQKEAFDAWTNAQLKNNHAESQFWKAVADGCKLR